jgi:hypothetical protein
MTCNTRTRSRFQHSQDCQRGYLNSGANNKAVDLVHRLKVDLHGQRLKTHENNGVMLSRYYTPDFRGLVAESGGGAHLTACPVLISIDCPRDYVSTSTNYPLSKLAFEGIEAGGRMLG